MKSFLAVISVFAFIPFAQARNSQRAILEAFNRVNIDYSFTYQFNILNKTGMVTEKELCYALGTGDTALLVAKVMKQDLTPFFQRLGTTQAEFVKQSEEFKKSCK